MKFLTGIYWIKNETPYLAEWIEFHLLQGFDHFIFYDNNSTDGLKECMAPYLEEGIIEIREYPRFLIPRARSGPKGAKNFWVMDYCIREQRKKSKWIHFHAIDEFIFCDRDETFASYLTKFEKFGGLSVEWEIINSSNHLTKPHGLVIENYFQTIEDPERHVKTVIQPDRVRNTIGNPHNFVFKNGYCAVDENFEQVENAFRYGKPRSLEVHSHHYVTRSREEYLVKVGKGLLDTKVAENASRPDSDKVWDYWHTCGAKSECRILEKYALSIRMHLLSRYRGREHLISHLV